MNGRQYTVRTLERVGLNWSTFHSPLCSGSLDKSHCTVSVTFLLHPRLGFEGLPGLLDPRLQWFHSVEEVHRRCCIWGIGCSQSLLVSTSVPPFLVVYGIVLKQQPPLTPVLPWQIVSYLAGTSFHPSVASCPVSSGTACRRRQFILLRVWFRWSRPVDSVLTFCRLTSVSA